MGGGYIGMEVAAAAVAWKLDTTVSIKHSNLFMHHLNYYICFIGFMMVMSSILETFTCLTSMSFIVYDVYNFIKYQFIVFESRDQVSTYCFLVLGYCV